MKRRVVKRMDSGDGGDGVLRFVFEGSGRKC